MSCSGRKESYETPGVHGFARKLVGKHTCGGTCLSLEEAKLKGSSVPFAVVVHVPFALPSPLTTAAVTIATPSSVSITNIQLSSVSTLLSLVFSWIF